jgi:hypothetical protein
MGGGTAAAGPLPYPPTSPQLSLQTRPRPHLRCRSSSGKDTRGAAVSAIQAQVLAALPEGHSYGEAQLAAAFKAVESGVMRRFILKEGLRWACVECMGGFKGQGQAARGEGGRGGERRGGAGPGRASAGAAVMHRMAAGLLLLPLPTSHPPLPIVRPRPPPRPPRADGRGVTDIRPITSRAGLLPRTHGSALFTRGETQSICVATLGTTADAQRSDCMRSTDTPDSSDRWPPPPCAASLGRPALPAGVTPRCLALRPAAGGPAAAAQCRSCCRLPCRGCC